LIISLKLTQNTTAKNVDRVKNAKVVRRVSKLFILKFQKEFKLFSRVGGAKN